MRNQSHQFLNKMGYKFFNNRKKSDYEYSTYDTEVVDEAAGEEIGSDEMSDIDKENFVLIDNPQVGDYWIMKFPNETHPYSVYRIQRIKGDSIFCWASDVYYDEGTEASAAISGRDWQSNPEYWYEEYEFRYVQDELRDLYYTNDADADKVKGILFYPFRIDE